MKRLKDAMACGGRCSGGSSGSCGKIPDQPFVEGLSAQVLCVLHQTRLSDVVPANELAPCPRCPNLFCHRGRGRLGMRDAVPHTPWDFRTIWKLI